MSDPVRLIPLAAVGVEITDEQWKAIFDFFGQYPDRGGPGTVVTVDLANEAIIWSNTQEAVRAVVRAKRAGGAL